jgi:alpha-galactosidase
LHHQKTLRHNAVFSYFEIKTITGLNMRRLFFAVITLFFASSSNAQNSAYNVWLNTEKITAAPKPPMGWNSWDNFGFEITEAEAKQQADILAEKFLPFGYNYLCIDMAWYAPDISVTELRRFKPWNDNNYKDEIPLQIIDKFGRLIPAPNKFPSSINGAGLKPLADYVHSKNLKFGIHFMRGLPMQAVQQNTIIKGTKWRAKEVADPTDACFWYYGTTGIDATHPGMQAYYNSIFELYASWGVDFVKVDDIDLIKPNQVKDAEAIEKAIAKCGRKIVFSYCSDQTLAERQYVQNHADMYRITSDFWDSWRQLKGQFKKVADWLKFQRKGHWADLDMLPVGWIGEKCVAEKGHYTNYTKDEQYTLMTMWSIFHSPLLIGADLTKMDDFTLKLLTNREVIKMNQEAGMAERIEWNDTSHAVLYCRNENTKSHYVAMFNLRDESMEMDMPFERMNAGLKQAKTVTELWTGEKQALVDTKLRMKVNAHGAVLLKFE